MTTPELPPAELLARQSERLSGLRSRLLRRCGVAHLAPALDLGAGHGAVTPELSRRAGLAFALDRRPEGLAGLRQPAIVADAEALPFADGSFGLVFAQCVFLWLRRPDAAAAEMARVLRDGGAVVAIEPDFGGLLEHPPEVALAEVWDAALRRAGADPHAGRALPARLVDLGLDVAVELLRGVGPVDRDRLELLAGLPLTEAERERIDRARRGPVPRLLHLPFVGVVATRR